MKQTATVWCYRPIWAEILKLSCPKGLTTLLLKKKKSLPRPYILCTKRLRFFDISCHSFLKWYLPRLDPSGADYPIRIVDFVSEIVNANRYDVIFVQTKTRETPRQRYGRTLSAIPKPIHYRQVNQPCNSTRIKIDGTSVFPFGHFHSFRKNGDTRLTTLGRVSFVIPPSFIFPYVCMVCNSSFLN